MRKFINPKSWDKGSPCEDVDKSRETKSSDDFFCEIEGVLVLQVLLPKLEVKRYSAFEIVYCQIINSILYARTKDSLRSRQDSNLRGETPMDFKSIALTTRPRLL